MNLRIPALLFMLLLLMELPLWGQDEIDFKPRSGAQIGLGAMTADSTFMINFRFRMQNRAGFFTTSGSDLTPNEIDARVRRLRLRMDGFLGSPKLSYNIQLSFSRGDQDFENTQTPNIVRDAVIFYFFDDETYLSFGQTKLPGNRQRVVSSGMLQFVDRSIANSAFNIDRDFGLRFYHEHKIGNSAMRMHAALSNGEGRNAINSNNGLAYTGRLEWLPLGEFINDGDYFEGDLLREPKPKLAFGSTLSYNHKAVRSGGQLGIPLSTPTDIRTFIADAVFKFQGFYLTGEYMLRNFTRYQVTNLAGDPHQLIAGAGINLQASYIFHKGYEIAGRFAQIYPNQAVKENFNGMNEYTLGVTRYIMQHRLKAQLNISYLNNHILLSERLDRWGCIFQLELGI